MKQILQDLKHGNTLVEEVPVPQVKQGCYLIRTRRTLISPGTERMLLEFGKAGWIDKARQQPDKVKQVIEKIKTDGLLPTIDAVRAKLDQAIPLGYCNVGTIVESGIKTGVSDSFPTGTRVASNGHHAEVVVVPKNLCVKIPDNVSDDEACFTVVGAIAMQGVRLADPSIGECFVVTGLGLVGLLTVQILIANGCRVLGIDYDSDKCALARRFGAQTVDLSKGIDPLAVAMSFSRGDGVDGVLITAATRSSEPVHQAAVMCRKRGRIVLVGVTGLNLRRDDFFKKELTFQVSCSYGPGRYDPFYEEKGNDYPIAYVRWTENRNMQAVLDLMASGKIDVAPLITHRFPIEKATEAYSLISDNREPYIGILLEYADDLVKDFRIRDVKSKKNTILLNDNEARRVSRTATPTIGVIGAGDFAAKVLLPALKQTGCRMKTIVSSTGVSSTLLGKKFGFEKSSTDTDELFTDSIIDTVFVTTRHDTHALFIIRALNAGKNVFTEKPLCINEEELVAIEKAYTEAHKRNHVPLLMVGFNRRFAPHVEKMRQLLSPIDLPRAIIITVNGGNIPPDHWIQDPAVGGGRIIGELCHFVDLAKSLTRGRVCGYKAVRMPSATNDTLSLSLEFDDGSIATIHYFANGNKAYPKERVEVFCGGKILCLDNFRKLRGYGFAGFKKMFLFRQDKGHREEVKCFIEAVRNGKPSPISFQDIVETTKLTLEIAADS